MVPDFYLTTQVGFYKRVEYSLSPRAGPAPLRSAHIINIQAQRHTHVLLSPLVRRLRGGHVAHIM